MTEDGHEAKETQTLIALALLQQRMDDILKRLDDQSRTAATQAAALSQEFKHSIRNAEQKWQAELQARAGVNEQKLLAINASIAAKADQKDFGLVQKLVFGLVSIVLVAVVSAVIAGVVMRPAPQHSAAAFANATAPIKGPTLDPRLLQTELRRASF